MSKYYFKHNEYELATKAFDYGVHLYCNDLGPFGGKTYEVYSFDPADVELAEDEEENGITAEDYDRPVVFSKPVGQGSANSIEWYSIIGHLWCDNEDLETFKKDTNFYSEDVVEEILKKIKDNGINPEVIVTKLGGVMPKNESIENNTFNRYIVESSKIDAKKEIYLTKAVNVFLKENPGWLNDFTKEELIEVFSMRDDLNDYITDHIPPSVFAEEMEDLDLFQNCAEKAGF